jgi:hypothetical protein
LSLSCSWVCAEAQFAGEKFLLVQLFFVKEKMRCYSRLAHILY